MTSDEMAAKAMAAAIDLGDQIERELFMKQNSPLGHLYSRSRSAAIEALQQLADVDPEDPKSIRHLQNEVARFRAISAWIAEAASMAADAYHKLSEEERRELDALLNQGALDA